MAQSIAVILSKNRLSGSQEQLLESRIALGLADRPEIQLIVIPHLYDLAPDGPAIRRLRAVADDMIVLSWLYPRASFWMLDANGVKGRLGPTFSLSPGDADEPPPPGPSQPPERTVWCFDLRSVDRPEPYVEQIQRIAELSVEPAAGADRRAAPPCEVVEAVRPRWYPVVDLGRCTHCLECLNFCLFGVYGLGPANSILVEQPDACRAGCPACSRICPQGAIMFPQHQDPAIAGDAGASREGLKLDLSQLFTLASPAELAAAERELARKEQQAAAQPSGPPPSPPAATDKDKLDRLVDETDKLEL